jgi:CO dehydrogenase maturation factor
VKVAIIGKGGSGKTTVAGTLARCLARAGREVIALDCDVNPNLGISLGVGLEQTEELAGIRQSLDDGGAEHAPAVEALLERFGVPGPDGVRLAVVSKIDQPNPG